MRERRHTEHSQDLNLYSGTEIRLFPNQKGTNGLKTK